MVSVAVKDFGPIVEGAVDYKAPDGVHWPKQFRKVAHGYAGVCADAGHCRSHRQCLFLFLDHTSL